MAIQIERLNSQSVRIGGAVYNTGAVYADYKNDDTLTIYHKNGANSFPITSKNIPWTQIVNSVGTAFGSFTAMSTALSAAIAPGDGVSSVLADKGTVSQATNTGAAVTLNVKNGIISTFAQTLAADAAPVTFTLTNSAITTTSNIISTVYYPSANTGDPKVRFGVPANGSVQVIITNPGTAVLNGANGTLKIGFLVL